MQIEMRALDSIRPYERNPRINDAAVDAVAKSIREFGWQQPIVVDSDGVIVCGHTRYRAAQLIGCTEVPVHVAVDLTPEKVRLYRIADNKVGELAEWDLKSLALELGELNLPEIDLRGFGFTAPELKALQAPAVLASGNTDPDDVPEVPAEPTTQPGDLWLLGEHRLLCGNSANEDDVQRVLQGDRAVCILTDPPYGVSVGAKNRFLQTVQKSGRRVENITDDDLSPEQLKEKLLPAFQLIRDRVMAEDCTLFVTAPQGGELGMMMMMMMREAGLPPRHVLMWLKNSPTFSMGRLDYDYKHEPILMTWGKRHKRTLGGEHRTSVWSYDKPRKCDLHPTMKPVGLYVNAYQNHSEPGDIVADVYGGSGTAVIAAEQTQRRARVIELMPEYCDQIVRRWEEFTGQKAQKEGVNGD